MKHKIKAAWLKVKAFFKKWLAPEIPFLLTAWLFLWVCSFVLAVPLYPNLPDPSIDFLELLGVLASADDRVQAVHLCLFYAVGVEYLLDAAQILHMSKLLGELIGELYLLIKSKLRAIRAKK